MQLQISIFGRTDKRTCIYTLMKILQPMGDVAIITNNRHLMRLTEDGEATGYYQNIAIFVTDATADEMWQEIGHSPEDFEYVILDGQYNEDTKLNIYVLGAGVEAGDEYLFDALEDMVVINMGKGKNAVPYTKELMQKLEHIEYYKQLVLPSQQMANILSKALSEKINLSTKNIAKVANR